MSLFTVDSRITNSSVWLADRSLSSIYLKNEAYFPWLVLVPRIENVQEIHQLSKQDGSKLMEEIADISRVMSHYCKPDKINVGALGNIVSQLHIHIVARFTNDIAWPQSIWQAGLMTQPYEETELAKQVGCWRKLLLTSHIFEQKL